MHSFFEWYEEKSKINLQKHNVNFYETQKAFLDIDRIIFEDIDHSIIEKRYFCLGKVEDNILTVRFMLRNNCMSVLYQKIIRALLDKYTKHYNKIA